MQCAHIDRVGSSAQLPDLILILILNFMPQLRVWLDFLSGNQSAAAAVAALAVALVAALLPSKLRQFDTLETCILAASLATHCAAAPPALCGQLSLTFRERRFATGATRPCPASATASAPAPVSPVPQFPSSSSSFDNHNLPRCAAISEQTWTSQVSNQLRSCTCHTPDLQAPMVT